MLEALSLDDALERLDHLADLPAETVGTADSRDGRIYLTTRDLVWAVKVAMVTGRPLLLGGLPGTGKSSFASYVARNLGVAYYEYVARHESRSSDLQWEFDAVRRLGDAQAQRLPNEGDRADFARYLIPGPLWWAMDPSSAARRGLDPEEFAASQLDPATDSRTSLGYEPGHQGAVLLVDEVDKADNAFLNGLLVPIGAREFDVRPIGTRVRATSPWSPLLILTTNNERDLSPAFLRRCVTLDLEQPDAEQLVQIAERHLPADLLTAELSAAIRELAELAQQQYGAINGAEFLDLVRVLVRTGSYDVGTDDWDLIRRLVLPSTTGRRGRPVY